MTKDLMKYRFLDGYFPDSFQKKLVILTAARQTGKTTLAKLKYPHLRYINLDAPENGETVREISTVAWSRTVGKAIIDEAQKEPVVFEKVKYACGEGSLPFSLLLGSSQVLMLKNIRENLYLRFTRWTRNGVLF